MKFAPEGWTVLVALLAPLPHEVLHCLRRPVRPGHGPAAAARAVSTNSAT
ncbi:hypothetical protein [Streptomyces sp. NPDC058066]